MKSFFRFAVTVCCIAAATFCEVAPAQTPGAPERADRLIAQAPPPATMGALQAGGFGLNTNLAGLFNLVITENQNQTQGSPS